MADLERSFRPSELVDQEGTPAWCETPGRSQIKAIPGASEFCHGTVIYLTR